MNNKFSNNKGITLIEVVIVIIIMGILVSVALNSASRLSESVKVEETKKEMDHLGYAVSGNPSLNNNGVRSDFGYVGDIGSLPPDLDALASNTVGYATWNGPYISSRFTQVTDDYKQDAWGTNYTFTGINITSTGSSSNIVKKIANNSSELLLNSVTGVVTDLDGTIPGNIYNDSVIVRLTVPNGIGGYITKSVIPDMSGYYSFDSIPIGNQDIEVIYEPASDTMRRFVSVTEGRNSYSEFILSQNYWAGSGGGGIIYVTGTATNGGGQCDELTFQIRNTTSSPITISDLILDWGSPTAYFKEVEFGGNDVFDQSNPSPGAGDTVPFDSPQTINAGQTITIKIDDFHAFPTGGPKVDMSNTSFTVTFSDGSVITFSTGAC